MRRRGRGGALCCCAVIVGTLILVTLMMPNWLWLLLGVLLLAWGCRGMFLG